jgi:DNA-directed RNA polymerase specialized sigma24 family protein
MTSPPTTVDDGRKRRFEALYEAYHGAVLGYVLRRTANPEDAADVMAETFMTSWRRLDEVPSRAGSAAVALRRGPAGAGELSPRRAAEVSAR